MNDLKHSNRIPFEDIDSSTAWDFPSWDEGAKVVPSVKKSSAKQDQAGDGRVEEVEQEEQQTIAPITAAQLQQISEEAEREGREHGFTQGYEQGFAEGEKKGLKLGEQKAYAEVKQRLDEQRERFAQLADALMDPIAMQDSGLENLVLDMAVHFAKHLLNKELSEDPRGLFEIVKRAVASLPAGAENIRIYLHDDDVELAHEAFAGSGRNWSFYSDPQLSRGGCRIESSQSLIDFSVEKRLQQMLEEVSFQGEIDPDNVAPVADYRPPEEAGDAPSAQAAQDVPPEPPFDTNNQESTVHIDPQNAKEPQEAQDDALAADKGPATPNDTWHSDRATPGADVGQGQSHPFGNPWDGSRE